MCNGLSLVQLFLIHQLFIDTNNRNLKTAENQEKNDFKTLDSTRNDCSVTCSSQPDAEILKVSITSLRQYVVLSRTMIIELYFFFINDI